MHIIAANPSTGASGNLTFDDNNVFPPFTFTNDTASHTNKLPWYMGQWTTPVTAVLEAYVLVSFLIALVMFMMCIRRHGCFHLCRCRRRRRVTRYQQQRVRIYDEQHANTNNNNTQEDSDEDIDDHEINSILSRDPAALDAEDGGRHVHDIQRLERALRTAGMA
ncbi:hypothetical protein E4T44_08376 [Aureobasidium sp. EXF-8845]|nr:hypothetical protein E4T44_08376 [Aureobasidium sp. EXF-8845]